MPSSAPHIGKAGGETHGRRALVTGCAGFLGSHLTDRLLEDGWQVVGVDCFTDFYPHSRKRANIDGALQHSGFELRRTDLSCDPLDGLLDGVDAVFHLAAQAGVRGSFGPTFEIYARHNIIATQRLLEAAVAAGGPRFVYASSSSIYGNAACLPTSEDAARQPVSPYGMTKVAAEELVGVYSRTHGLPTVGLRYFTVYGPRQRPDMAFSRFIAAALNGGRITIHGDGLQRRDFTYVRDVVDATVSAASIATVDTPVYNVGGGSSVPLRHVLALLESLLGTTLLVECSERRAGDARHTGADLARAEAELGYRPAVSLETGFEAQIQWQAGASTGEAQSSALRA